MSIRRTKNFFLERKFLTFLPSLFLFLRWGDGASKRRSDEKEEGGRTGKDTNLYPPLLSLSLPFRMEGKGRRTDFSLARDRPTDRSDNLNRRVSLSSSHKNGARPHEPTDRRGFATSSSSSKRAQKSWKKRRRGWHE